MALRRGSQAEGYVTLRRTMSLGVVMLAVAMVWIWVDAPPEPLGATYSHDSCRRVDLRHDLTEAPIVGAEDLLFAPDGAHVIVSAHDRTDIDFKSGGLYAVAIDDLIRETRVTAKRVHTGDSRVVPFRPHGIALSPNGSRLAVVTRPAEAEAEVQIGELDGLIWTPDVRLTGRKLCRANDLAFASSEEDILRITLDRASCEGDIRDILPGATTGQIVRFQDGGIAQERDRLAFPNGILPGFFAETRAERLHLPDLGPVALPGGPDNLSLDEAGQVVAALHPKLLHLALLRGGWRDRSGSRIVRVDPRDGAIEVLFDDPKGELYSAATAAIHGDGLLIMGSAYDSGLLVCEQGLR